MCRLPTYYPVIVAVPVQCEAVTVPTALLYEGSLSKDMAMNDPLLSDMEAELARLEAGRFLEFVCCLALSQARQQHPTNNIINTNNSDTTTATAATNTTTTTTATTTDTPEPCLRFGF